MVTEADEQSSFRFLSAALLSSVSFSALCRQASAGEKIFAVLCAPPESCLFRTRCEVFLAVRLESLFSGKDEVPT